MKNELPRVPAARPSRRQRLRHFLRTLAPVTLGVLIAFAALLLFNAVSGTHQMTTADVNNAVARAMASATAPPPLAARVYEMIRPSLVEIDTVMLTENGKTNGGLGTGVIIDDAGDILTSLHVVQNALEIQVTFADGTQSAATLQATQPENDIALLRPQQLPAQPLVPATLGNAGALNLGDDAIVVGNPLGLINSVSAGVISGLNRSFQPPKRDTALKGLIQFDAAVNPGNSGGPLLNRDGEVVGIVTGLVNPSGQEGFAGIGFAVPIQAAAAAAGSPPY
jgi:S1-C subfamily serine protease